MSHAHELDTDLALELEEPKKYKVIMHNDDFTSTEFVIEILRNIFHKTEEQAQQTMLEVHRKNKAICGIYTHEIAQTKVDQVTDQAKKQDFPLLTTIEEDN
jgi:ATP-dependent Clp protease adaptor protein ClpS